MKALAEFSTIFGMALGLTWFKKLTNFTKPISFILGSVLRVLVMFFANLIIQSLYYGIPFIESLLISPYIGAFNLVQGFLSMFGGFMIYGAIIRRYPSLISRDNGAFL